MFTNYVLPTMHWANDKFFKIPSIWRKFRKTEAVFSNSIDSSDSEFIGFETLVGQVLESENKLRNFRRIKNYRNILEHVSYLQGKKYLDRINKLGICDAEKFSNYLKNEKFGNPRVYSYGKLKGVSPTTLRYIAVLSEIESIFGNKIQGNFAEIGVGYGGQFSVLSDHFTISSYEMYDLPVALDLAQIYLSKITAPQNFIKMDMRDMKTKSYDLIISNYAYSELPYIVQKEYLEKLLANSKRGYMIMNSGRSNVTGRSSGKIKLEELMLKIPDLEVLEEAPKTGPDNYVLVWGRSS